MHCRKIVRHTLKIMQQMLQDFKGVKTTQIIREIFLSTAFVKIKTLKRTVATVCIPTEEKYTRNETYPKTLKIRPSSPFTIYYFCDFFKNLASIFP